MVVNDEKILDSGELKKYVIKSIKCMNKYNIDPKSKYYYGQLFVECHKRTEIWIKKKIFDEEKLEERTEEVENENFRSFRDFPRLLYAEKKFEEDKANGGHYWDWRSAEEDWVRNATIEEIYKFLEIEEFKKSVMMNISPHWTPSIKEKLKTRDKNALDTLLILNRYLERLARSLCKLKWFSKFEFVIETGKEGTHPHIHAVCEINQSLHKQFATWIRSNWTKSVADIWAKIIKTSSLKNEIESAMKGGRCCQRNIINCPIMLQDKKDYLIEEKKPEDHKNLFAEESLYFQE